MDKSNQDRRRYSRFETEAKIYFKVIYPLETRIEYKIIEHEKHAVPDGRHPGLSKNVSAEGMCFTSDKKLESGDILLVEVFLPDQSQPVTMEGEVRWSQPNQGLPQKYDTGLKLLKVKEKSVSETIRFDQENHVIWSEVLESVFGGFRKFAQKMKSL